METNIQLFNSPRFGQIRTAGTADSPLFCLSDICVAIGITNPRNVKNRLDEGDVCLVDTPTTSGVQQITFVSEAGMYDVIIRSDSPEAKPFRKWVTSEVLPTIRKNGVYASDNFIEKSITDPEYAIKILTSLKEERLKSRALAERVEADRPKVLFANAVEASDNSILVAEMAKILKQKGVDMGQNKFYSWLREKHYLGSVGEYYNLPTQKAMEMGLFEIKKTSVTMPDGTILVTRTTKVTGKGQIYFVNKFLKQ